MSTERVTPTAEKLSRIQSAFALATRAVASIGLPTTGASLLREASSVLVAFPSAAVVARVDPLSRAVRTDAHVRVARFLADRSVPAIRAASPDFDCLLGLEGVVTLWQRVEFLDCAPRPEELALAVRRLHDATRGAGLGVLPPLDFFSDVLTWERTPMAHAFGREVEFQERAWELREVWSSPRGSDPLGTVIAHGDLNLDNVVITEDGPLLMDLECAGVGPASWDLAAQWVAVRRYGGSLDVYERFSAAYGADVRESEWCQLCSDVYEFGLAAWSLVNSGLSEMMEREARVRLGSVLDGTVARWTLL